MKFCELVRKAIEDEMDKDETVICYGLGVTDPKGVFGTTKDLHKKFGNKRVFDMPTSENGMTGIGVGAAIMGLKVIMTHQRVDFFLLAMDQVVNSAAKMHYMYGNQLNCPIVIRLIIGRGWGQGPTHSQSLQAWFAHIPGLKVVMPTFAEDAYTLLREAIQDPNPVIYLEHRWLHETNESSVKGNISIGKARICREGKHCTIVSNSYLTLESIKAASYLSERHGIECEIIDLATVKPIDEKTILESVKKTRRICVLDTGFEICGLASEIISMVCINNEIELIDKPIKGSMKDIPEPTSYGLTKNTYLDAADISRKLLKMFKETIVENELMKLKPTRHDIPGDSFKGPF